MKANELQIGDLLDLSDVPNEIIPCKVVELQTDELYFIQPNDTACDIIEYDMVRPITLTAEILEKNGFLIKKLKCELIIDNRISIELYQDGVLYIEKLLPDLTRTQIKIKFVHELQHVLRLCGLNEFANNFKIL